MGVEWDGGLASIGGYGTPFDLPDAVGILLDGPVGGEFAHAVCGEADVSHHFSARWERM
jgi:hypothetical protein